MVDETDWGARVGGTAHERPIANDCGLSGRGQERRAGGGERHPRPSRTWRQFQAARGGSPTRRLVPPTRRWPASRGHRSGRLWRRAAAGFHRAAVGYATLALAYFG